MRARPFAGAQPDVPRGIVTTLCLGTATLLVLYALWREELPAWWSWYGGGIPYVMFWIFTWFVVFPYRRAVVPVCVLVTLSTCGIEFLQLWKPEWLLRIRETTIGAALLGSEFTWMDFPPYFMGGAAGYLACIAACSWASRRSQRNL